MTNDFFNPNNPQFMADQDMMNELSDDERIKVSLKVLVGYLIAIIVGLTLCFLLSGCVTEKVVYEHIHHYQQADTMATEALIDRRMQSWHAQIDSSWRQRMDEYRAEWFSHEDQKETVTETITTTVDSLGRQIRTEQRTTERNLSKMQQQTEQRLSQAFEARLTVVVDSVNGLWQQRLTQVQTHFEQQLDQERMTATKTEHLPWYSRLWNRLRGFLFCAVLAALLFLTRHLWLSWCIKLFR